MINNTNDTIIKDIVRLLEPILLEMHFELVDVEYLHEHGRFVLRIYLDKNGGITLDDCALISREIDYLIEINNIIKNAYSLEISSPGLNRPLARKEDFVKAVGSTIKVKMMSPVNGRLNFAGRLQAFRDENLFLDIGDMIVELMWLDIKKANLLYEFDN